MLSRLVGSLAAGEMSDMLKRLRTAGLFNLLAALAALCGIGFLIAAAYVAAAQRWGAAPAALGFAVAFLLLATAIYGIGKVLVRRRARKAERRRASDARMLAGTAAVTLLPSILARGGGVGILLAPLVALAGYAIYRENTGARSSHDDEKPD